MLELIHYYNSQMPPLQSITEDCSCEVVKQLVGMNGQAFRRFRNFDWYVKQRMQTEKWLYNAFWERGGKPALVNPRYFVLGESEMLLHGFGENVSTIRIPLDKVDGAHVSFTLDDSMKLFMDAEQPRIWLKDEIVEKMLSAKGAYVEAQIWDLRYFESKDV